MSKNSLFNNSLNYFVKCIDYHSIDMWWVIVREPKVRIVLNPDVPRDQQKHGCHLAMAVIFWTFAELSLLFTACAFDFTVLVFYWFIWITKGTCTHPLKWEHVQYLKGK